VIAATGLSKSFEHGPVLTDVSLTCLPEHIVYITGKSGSGKTVLLKLLTGLLQADAGSLRYDDTEVVGYSEVQWNTLRAELGVVFQNAALLDSLTVFENVGIRLLEGSGGRSTSTIQDQVAEALRSVELDTDILQKLPAALSGGMRKRVGIARAVVHKPRYLFYDEPTTGLDPYTSRRIDELMAKLAAAPGRTSIIVSHDMQSLQHLATDVLFIADGRGHYWGKASGFFKSGDKQIEAFLGG